MKRGSRITRSLRSVSSNLYSVFLSEVLKNSIWMRVNGGFIPC